MKFPKPRSVTWTSPFWAVSVEASGSTSLCPIVHIYNKKMMIVGFERLWLRLHDLHGVWDWRLPHWTHYVLLHILLHCRLYRFESWRYGPSGEQLMLFKMRETVLMFFTIDVLLWTCPVDSINPQWTARWAFLRPDILCKDWLRRANCPWTFICLGTIPPVIALLMF